MKEFEYATMSEAQERFLGEYETKSRIFTSVEEMEKVKDVLGLKGMTGEQLSAMRNSVVRFYMNVTRKLRSENKMEEFFKKHNSMQSVSSVIDHVLYESGNVEMLY